MEYHIKFVWLGKLALIALALLLASDLILFSNFPMHLYAMYLGLALCLVIPYFVMRLGQAKAQGHRVRPHVWRLLLMTLTGFVLTLAWSLAYFNLEGAFKGLDLDLLGPKLLAVFVSNFAVKAVVLALTVFCLADALQRGRSRGGGAVQDCERTGANHEAAQAQTHAKP
jgi:hypothetical protein